MPVGMIEAYTQGTVAVQGSRRQVAQAKVMGGTLYWYEAGDQTAEVIRKVGEMNRRSQDLRPVWATVRGLMYEQTRRVFDAQGLPTRWPALSPRYAAWKARRFPGRGILVLTGDLVDSLTTEGSRGIFAVTPKGFTYGSTLPYFPAHQQGTRNMPRRRALVMLPTTRREIGRRVARYIKQGENFV